MRVCHPCFRHICPSLSDHFVFTPIAEHDGDNCEIALMIGVYKVSFQRVRLTGDWVFAGCMKMELLETEFDTVHNDTASGSIVNLNRVTIVQDL